jgi:ATP-dependent Clp protease ATP-binding subunit ClpC
MSTLEQIRLAITKLSEKDFQDLLLWMETKGFDDWCQRFGLANSDKILERMTDRGRRVVQLAVQEAVAAKHHHVGTEHILLGVSREGQGVASYVLKNLGVLYERLNAEVMRIVPPEQSQDNLPLLTPEALGLIYNAYEEALALDHNYIGTEHLLLATASASGSVANLVLAALGLKHEDIRREVLQLLGHSD